MHNLKEQFPEIYQNFLPDSFFDWVPDETLATCHDCIMCKNHQQKKEAGKPYFLPETKCCTYQPHLPNYLVGALIVEPMHLEGKERMLDYISQKVGVTPIAVRPSSRFSKEYKAFKKLTFGLNKRFKCTFYENETGNCTVYPYWNGICSTWFCKSVGDATGKTFWDSIRDVMRLLEKILSEYACEQLGLSPNEQYLDGKALRPDDYSELIDQKVYKQMWENWEGKEVMFYQESYHIIKELTPSFFKKIAPEHFWERIALMNQKKEEFKQYVQ